MSKKKVDLDDLDTTESAQAPEDVAPKKPTTVVAPTIGRIVHYQASAEHRPFAAVICDVSDEGKVSLTMFDPRGDVRTKLNVPYSEVPKEGHWSWPPKV